MFTFRRITLEDIQFKLKTGNNRFDELAPEGSLENYIKDDMIKGGDFLTYVLLEQQEKKIELLGLLRYRSASRDEFLNQLDLTSVPENIRKNIDHLFTLRKYSVVYLSRIGFLKDIMK